MKAKIILITILTILSFGTKIIAQMRPLRQNEKQQTVLLINAHLMYSGLSEERLNNAFYDKAKEFFGAQNFKVLETKIESGYNVENEVGKTYIGRYRHIANACKLGKRTVDL